MHEKLESVCLSLETLAINIRNGSKDDRTLSDMHNSWSFPAVTRHDLAALPEQLASEIREANLDQLDDEFESVISKIPDKINSLQARTVPQFFNTNGGQATATYLTTISLFREVLSPATQSWDRVDDPELMPKKLARRVRSFKARIDSMSPSIDQLSSMITEINAAHSAAEMLPTDLESLKESRNEIGKLLESSRNNENSINRNEKAAKEKLSEIEKYYRNADSLIKQLDDLYRIGTSTALAGAFKQRAEALQNTVNYWLFILISALVIIGFIGVHRMDTITEMLSKTQVNWQAVLANCVMAVLGLGAPIWLAWVATKQIGQRFRLAEDYAYKASISNAYEGYRREALNLDEEFSARLFNSALTRFDEAPLRFVEQETHGSPMQEFFYSTAFRTAIDTSQELKETFLTMLRRRPIENLLPATKENKNKENKGKENKANGESD
jgi:hypothetical protein